MLADETKNLNEIITHKYLFLWHFGVMILKYTEKLL